jgi:actin-like ATPase involved in cell morphogenesis
MKDGVIADFKITEKMLQHFIRKVSHDNFFSPSPKVLSDFEVSNHTIFHWANRLD